MTSIPKNIYIDVLDDVVIKDNNTHHRTVKMKPINVKNYTCIIFGKGRNDKDPKLKVGDI